MLTAFRRKYEYVARSDYAMQLKPYVDTFGRDQVFALTLEILHTDPQAVFRSLFNWLEVDPDVSIDSRERFNVTQNVVTQTRRGCVFLDTALKHWQWKRWERLVPAPFLPSCGDAFIIASTRIQSIAVRPLNT